MAPTQAWLNQYYNTGYDAGNAQGGAYLGAQYISYFYQYYVNYIEQNYPGYCANNVCNWDTVWPGATDGATIRDIIISIYNEGAGTMGQYGITNWWYVNDVLLWYHTMYGGVGN